MIRVAIADDHELVREGLKKLIGLHPDLVLAGEAASMDELAPLLADGQVDVLILDLCWQGMADLEALQAVRAAWPAVRVLVLSMFDAQRYAAPALRAGAAGYVSKAMASGQVVEAVRAIAAGAVYGADGAAAPLQALPHQALTARELAVLRLLGAGASIKQVAGQLNLSISSVHTYRRRIFQKMDLRTNAALVRYAIEQQLLP